MRRNGSGLQLAGIVLVVAAVVAALAAVLTGEDEQRVRPERGQPTPGASPPRAEAPSSRKPQGDERASKARAPVRRGRSSSKAPAKSRAKRPSLRLGPEAGFRPRYVVHRPRGWEPQPPAILSDQAELVLERFLSNGLSAYIGVIRAGRGDSSLSAYARGMLDKIRSAGLTVDPQGPLRSRRVGGERAVISEFKITDGEKRGREQQAIFFRGDQVFFVTLNVQDQRIYDELEPAFERFLDSWRWQP